MLRSFVLAAGLLFASFNVGATEYTDAYVAPDEIGWGALLVQSDTFQFIAIFIYDQNGNPTWYTGNLTADAAGNYSGQLYASTGCPFRLPGTRRSSTIFPSAPFRSSRAISTTRC